MHGRKATDRGSSQGFSRRSRRTGCSARFRLLVSSSTSPSTRTASSFVEASELGGDVVTGRGDGTAEFPQAVVVGDERPVGVTVFLGELVDALEHGSRGGDGASARGVALGHDTEVEASGATAVGDGEEAVAGVGTGRREQLDVLVVERAYLFGRAADRGRGGDDLRRTAVRAGAQLQDGRLVEADRGAERSGEQMQLVLDDQGRGRVAGARAEETAGVRLPGQLGELVDGAEDEGRRLLVEVLVDDGDRQDIVEAAFVPGAVEGELVLLCVDSVVGPDAGPVHAAGCAYRTTGSGRG